MMIEEDPKGCNKVLQSANSASQRSSKDATNQHCPSSGKDLSVHSFGTLNIILNRGRKCKLFIALGGMLREKLLFKANNQILEKTCYKMTTKKRRSERKRGRKARCAECENGNFFTRFYLYFFPLASLQSFSLTV